MSFRIEHLAAWIQRDDDDEEGIIAFLDMPNGVWMPMIGADHARIESLRPQAEETALMTGKPVELVSFVKVAANPVDVALPPGWEVCPACDSHRKDLLRYPCNDDSADGPNEWHL